MRLELVAIWYSKQGMCQASGAGQLGARLNTLVHSGFCGSVQSFEEQSAMESKGNMLVTQKRDDKMSCDPTLCWKVQQDLP